MRVVVALQQDLARRDAGDPFEPHVRVVRYEATRLCRLFVMRRDVDGGADAAQAYVAVDDAVHAAAAFVVALDAQAGGRTNHRQVLDQYVVHTAVRLAADRHAVAAVEAVVQDRHVFRRACAAGFHRDVVVAGPDDAVRDGDVARRDRIDAVRVARVVRGVDDHAPCGEAVHVVERHVEVRGILQGDTVQREVACAVGLDQPGHVLAGLLALGAAGDLPPGLVMAEDRLATLAVDRAAAHDRGAAHAVHRDERAAAAARRVVRAACAGAAVEQARVGACVQRGARVDQQGDAVAQPQRAGHEVAPVVAGREHDRMAGRAFVDGGLDARGVVAPGVRRLADEYRARGRHDGFAHRARVLRVCTHLRARERAGEQEAPLQGLPPSRKYAAVSGRAATSSRSTMCAKNPAPLLPTCVRSNADFAAPAGSTRVGSGGWP